MMYMYILPSCISRYSSTSLYINLSSFIMAPSPSFTAEVQVSAALIVNDWKANLKYQIVASDTK